MICKNCNAQLEDGSTFCVYCGANCRGGTTYEFDSYSQKTMKPSGSDAYGDNMQQQPMTTNYSYSAFAGGNAIVPAAPAAVAVAPHGEVATGEAFEPPKKKKGKKLIVISAVIAGVLAILALVYFVFGNMIFFAVAPEEYVANLFGNTVEKARDELPDISNNVFGMDVSAENDFQVEIDVDYEDAYDDAKVNVKVANVPEEKRFMYKGSFDTNDIKMDSEGYIDEENIALMLPGKDEYISVPSKNFGKEYSSSGGYLADYMEDEDPKIHRILEGLDLSYSTLTQLLSTESDINEAMEEHYTENIIKMLEKSDIGDRKSVKYDFGDNTVSANEIKVILETDDLYDMLIDSYDDMKNDSTITEKLGTKIFKEQAKVCKEQKEDSKNQKIDVVITEYDNRIVSFKIYMEIDEDPNDYYDDFNEKTTIILSCTDPDYMLNGITCTTETEYEYSKDSDDDYDSYKGKSENEFILVADWCNEDEVITISIDTISKASDKNDEDEDWKHNRSYNYKLVLDYTKGKWNFDVDSEYYYRYYTGDEDEKSSQESFSGKCSKDNGFVFEIDEDWEDTKLTNSMPYEEWMEYNYTSWLENIYYTYRDEYLNYVYTEVDSFYYDFNTYSDWFRVFGRAWDVPDYDFENWLFNESASPYSSSYDAYDEDTAVEEKIDAYAKVKLKLGEKVDLSVKNASCDNILEWSESDFEDVGDDIMDEIRK